MIRWHLTRAALGIYLIAFALTQRLRFQLSAPDSGFDRAGGPYNGHPARTARQPSGAAAAEPVAAGKGVNGALHGHVLSSASALSSAGNVAALFPQTGEA